MGPKVKERGTGIEVQTSQNQATAGVVGNVCPCCWLPACKWKVLGTQQLILHELQALAQTLCPTKSTVNKVSKVENFSEGCSGHWQFLFYFEILSSHTLLRPSTGKHQYTFLIVPAGNLINDDIYLSLNLLATNIVPPTQTTKQSASSLYLEQNQKGVLL